jgi:hypothetical protein
LLAWDCEVLFLTSIHPVAALAVSYASNSYASMLHCLLLTSAHPVAALAVTFASRRIAPRSLPAAALVTLMPQLLAVLLLLLPLPAATARV